jgi:hypothetical protein
VLQAERSHVSLPDEANGFVSWLNTFSLSVILGPTPPVIEMSTQDLPGD